MKEGRIRSGYLSFRTQVLYRPRQNDRLRVMFDTSLYRYQTATYPHVSDSANDSSERTIPYSWRACEQLCHIVGCIIVRDGFVE
ncbi:hypothetical protein TNCV_227081 [Trichonephila clavipes]|nr:hypothetical protein TNCV_227081 [Trichonephila clavipes]